MQYAKAATIGNAKDSSIIRTKTTSFYFLSIKNVKFLLTYCQFALLFISFLICTNQTNKMNNCHCRRK